MMNWEINQRKTAYTIWQGKDPEGRKVYDATMNRGGVPVEPSGMHIYYTKRDAIKSVDARFRYS